mgnify:CR=1 FL=1
MVACSSGFLRCRDPLQPTLSKTFMAGGTKPLPFSFGFESCERERDFRKMASYSVEQVKRMFAAS